jgi:hypothetical protein
VSKIPIYPCCETCTAKNLCTKPTKYPQSLEPTKCSDYAPPQFDSEDVLSDSKKLIMNVVYGYGYECLSDEYFLYVKPIDKTFTGPDMITCLEKALEYMVGGL